MNSSDVVNGLPMKISSELEIIIQNKPTLTFLRHTSKAINEQFNSLPKAKPGRNIDLPDNFNGKEVWNGLLSPVMNQARCGSCWAFASTGVLADRFNIQSVGLMHVQLSPTKLILCDFQGKEFSVEHPELQPEQLSQLNVDEFSVGACMGNTLYDAWRYLYVIGTNTLECIPYDKSLGGTQSYNSLTKFTDSGKLPLCTSVSGPIGDMCNNFSVDTFSAEEYGSPARFYRCLHFYSIAGIEKDGGNESYIRHNIYCWGPVSTGFIVYPDFYTFDPKTDIYEWDGYGDPLGGHAVEIVGWGVDDKPFWWIKNSWGEKWGIDGYFKIVRGKNNCHIEENVIAGVPDFFYPEAYSLRNPGHFIWSENPKQIKQRRDIDTQLTITGGGIDPTTGYTRRVMETKQWLDVRRPIKLDDLPDWDTFIAGINANKQHRYKYQRQIRGRHYLKQYSDLPLFITTVVSIFVCIVILILLIKK